MSEEKYKSRWSEEEIFKLIQYANSVLNTHI